MSRLPRIGASEDADPHVVMIGAGGSRAACPAGDKNGLRLPVMADLIDTVGLPSLIQAAGLDPNTKDFEGFYDDLAGSGKYSALVVDIEEKVREYFSRLQLPDTATVYDYLLLSLRPKDLIATFNWDPLLAQAFRRHQGLIAMPQLAFLHGNVAVGFCDEHRAFGWHDDQCRVCGQAFSPSPLLFPVRNKDYTARPSIHSQWALLEQLLEDTYFITIFGSLLSG